MGHRQVVHGNNKKIPLKLELLVINTITGTRFTLLSWTNGKLDKISTKQWFSDIGQQAAQDSSPRDKRTDEVKTPAHRPQPKGGEINKSTHWIEESEPGVWGSQSNHHIWSKASKKRELHTSSLSEICREALSFRLPMRNPQAEERTTGRSRRKNP